VPRAIRGPGILEAEAKHAARIEAQERENPMVRGTTDAPDAGNESPALVRWLGTVIEISEPELARRVNEEAATDHARRGEAVGPAPLPPLPEHRIGPLDPRVYERPAIATPSLAAHVAETLLGLTFPCAVKFVEPFGRCSAYIFTDARLTLSDLYVEFSFDGYRLRTDGQLSDPVADLRPFGSCAYRRTLLDEWVEVRPRKEVPA
jgi:hypothetical protein